MFHPLPPASVKPRKGLNGGWCANWGVAGRTARCISNPGLALLVGTAALLSGLQTAGASTLTFTFNDDGTTTTITPTGSLDFGSSNFQPPQNQQGGNKIEITQKVFIGTHLYTSISASVNVVTADQILGTGIISGLASFDGETQVSGLPSYKSDFYIFANSNGVLSVDRNHLDGSVYDPTGKTAKFNDTISNRLKDNNFHIEYAFGNLRVIFQTKPLAKPTGLTATPGDGQVELSWTNPVNSSIDMYQYQQSEAGGEFGEWKDMVSSNAYTTRYAIKDLTNGAEYSFKIRATKDDGVNQVSDEVTAIPVKPGTPAAAELEASAQIRGAILTWTHVGDSSITKWQYQLREGNEAFGSGWEDIAGSSAATRRHAVSGLTGGVAHGFRVRAVNDVGSGAPSKEAMVTPAGGPTLEVERQALKRSLAAAGQATLAGVTNVIDQRLQSTPRTSALVLGGQTVAATGSSMDRATGQETDGWWSGSHASESFSRPVGDADLLDGSAFTLSLSEDDGSDRGWTIWGRGDLQRFEGKSGEDSWDGSVKSAVLGFDTQTNEDLLAGLAVSSSRGKTDLVTEEVGSRVETSLTAAWPYMQMVMPNGTGTVQVVLGIGSGDAEHHSEDGGVEMASLSMTAASVGASLAVAQQGQVTLSVPVKAEVVQLKTDGDGSTAIGGLAIRSWKASGGLEAAHSGVSLDSSWVLTPRGSVSFRWDGGDGLTGKGIEVAGGFGLHAPDSRVSLNASGRWLATHSDSNQKEWGVSIGVQIAPDAEGHGWSASLRQEWGLQQEGVLSGDTLFEGSVGGSVSTAGSLAARAGYGFGMMEGLMTLSADARLATDEEEVPHYGAGMEFALPGGLSASLRGEHFDASDPDTRIGAGLKLRF